MFDLGDLLEFLLAPTSRNGCIVLLLVVVILVGLVIWLAP